MLKKLSAISLALCLLVVGALSAVAEENASDDVVFGPFEATNLLTGEVITSDIFAEADITLVNMWATWCGPCIAELPDLNKISDLTEGRVQVLGVQLDALNDLTGEPDEDAIDAMKKLVEQDDLAYAMVQPDMFFAAIGSMLQYVPTTFIVDRDGYVRDTAIGGNDAEGWIEIAQKVATDVYGSDVTLAK